MMRTERDQALAALHRGAEGRIDEPLARYTERVADWEVIPLRVGQEIIGAILRKGYWLHVGVARVPPASMRRYIREVLATTIATHGLATTTVGTDCPRGIDFCERLGFTIVERAEDHVYMKCERARYA